MMTPDRLARATGSTAENAVKYCGYLNEAMERFDINAPMDRAAFIGGTVAIESMNLSAVEESLYYKDAQRLSNIYKRAFNGEARLAEPYTRNSAKLSELLYQGYHGRGLIQLTWLDNYVKASEALGFDYVSNPKLLAEPWHAAISAGWFWKWKNCSEPGRRGDMDEVTLRVNGPKKMHLAERKAGFKRAIAVGL